VHRSRLDLEQRLHYEAEKEYNKDVACNVIKYHKARTHCSACSSITSELFLE
jgi:hypothetical protein